MRDFQGSLQWHLQLFRVRLSKPLFLYSVLTPTWPAVLLHRNYIETSPNYLNRVQKLSYLTISAPAEGVCTDYLKCHIYVQFDQFCSRNHLGKPQGWPDSPPSMLINTFEHRDWSRHSWSCRGKASRQAKIPTWRVPVPVNQMLCGEAG